MKEARCTSLENLFFLTCAAGDIAKVRIAKSARGVPFCYSTLDVFKTPQKTFLQKMDLCGSLNTWMKKNTTHMFC